MTRAFVTDNLIVDYLARVKAERTIQRIIQYMYQFHKVNPSATRTHLSRLVKDGRVTRIERGRYQATP